MRCGDGGRFKYIPLKNGDPLPDIADHSPYKCLVLISEDVTNAWRNEVCEWLVATGCLYMMAWGKECSIWDDCVDMANLEVFEFEDIPDDKFVMTTWHDHWTMEETLYFTKYNAFHPDVRIETLVVLDIGNTGRLAELKKLYFVA